MGFKAACDSVGQVAVSTHVVGHGQQAWANMTAVPQWLPWTWSGRMIAVVAVITITTMAGCFGCHARCDQAGCRRLGQGRPAQLNRCESVVSTRVRRLSTPESRTSQPSQDTLLGKKATSRRQDHTLTQFAGRPWTGAAHRGQPFRSALRYAWRWLIIYFCWFNNFKSSKFACSLQQWW